MEAHELVTWRLSRFAVPYRDAEVLAKYRTVFNVWPGQRQLYVSFWSPTTGRPSRGRLYAEHICGFRE